MKKNIVILLFLVLLGSVSSTYASQVNVADVMPLLSELKIMVGDENGDYQLDREVLRSEFTKVAVASSSYKDTVAPTLKTSSYKDVPATHWAAPYIRAGIDAGFCKGYLDSTFRPNNTVTFEEAVTMMLRVLGYSEDDFGNSWPYGQVGMAENLGLSDGMDKSIGETMSRSDVALLVYNTLNTKMKNQTVRLLYIFDTVKEEDVALISIDKDSWNEKVFTSSGSYKVKGRVSNSDIGKHGDIYVKDADKIIAFVPYSSNNEPERHVVYSTLGSDIITYKDNVLTTLTVSPSTVVYEEETKSSYSLISSKIEMGDVLYVQKKNNGDTDYIIYEDGKVEGPFTIASAIDIGTYAGAEILRNGEKVSESDIMTNDIAYFSPELNMVMLYSNKVTGVYENASPNKDMPTHVTVSGYSYKIESSKAFEKLSSSGGFKFGDTITLLLGKNNEIADVIKTSEATNTVYGYLYETGMKEFAKSDLSRYTDFYIKIVSSDGKVLEYRTDRDYKEYKNSVKRITFEDGVAKVWSVNGGYNISGEFDWENRRLGTEVLAGDVKILDVADVGVSDSGAYVSVFPVRLDGVKISSDKILFAQRNDKNQISELILKDITGDCYSYGVVKQAKVSDSQFSLMSNYTFVVDGEEKSFMVTDAAFGVYNNQVVKLLVTDKGILQKAVAINKINERITEISNISITAGDKKYPLHDKLKVYKKISGSYIEIPLSDIVESKEYSVSAYYDKSPEYGGNVRIIIAD